MRRRLAAILACCVAPLLVSGCVGVEGKQAESLLQQASVAQEQVKSEKFVVRFDIEADHQKVTMAIQGGAYLKGPRAGDFYFTMSGSGAPELNAMNFKVMRRGKVAAVQMGGRTERVPVPAAEKEFGSPTDMLDLARYVKSVSVDDAELGNRPADRIVGTLDTQALLNSSGDLPTKLLGAAGVHFSDIRAVLFVPRDTHLVEVMFADLDIQAEGHDAHMHLSLATSGINKPVSIPASF